MDTKPMGRANRLGIGIVAAVTLCLAGCVGYHHKANCGNKFDNMVFTFIDNVTIDNCTLEETNKFNRSFRNRVDTEWIYPVEALENCDEGLSIMSFSILRDGSIKEIKLIESSGIDVLDNAALIALRRASPVDELPACMDNSINIDAKFYYDIKVIKRR